MDVDEFIAKAWGAVEKAGVPDAVQALAFKEAADFLAGDGSSAPRGSGHPKRDIKKAGPKRTTASKGNGDPPAAPDADAFYSQLADEAGVDETTLRDLLELKGDVVHVLPVTRKLGDSKAVQARQVVALVAGAYAHGLDRSPVDAIVVREEVKRKRCFDSANFASQLKSMKGFGPGSNRNEIAVGSKWISEFQEAVKLATGETDSEES